MRRPQLHNLEILKEQRKDLRNNSTYAEVALWRVLKGKQLEGLKFRRQHRIGMYIVDFYCPKYKLAIELDGNYHFEETQMIRDEERDKFLSEVGIKVIRIENQNVFKNIDMVLNYIMENVGADGFYYPQK
jgi:very-short-patch-repair endonuclease